MRGHDCPHILGNPRPGFWFSCRCGEVGRVFRTRLGASYDWSLHVAQRVARRTGATS